MVSLRFREFLPGYVAEEFDSLVAQLRAIFSVSFNDDGTIQTIQTGVQMPVGAMIDWPTTTLPTNGTWLVCDGSAVSRVTYKPLFEVIGTTWGAGDGSTTFNLPDARERFSMGKSGTYALGGVGGSAGHSHGIQGDGVHSHTVDAHAHDIDSDGDHSHSQGAHQHAIGAGSYGFATSDTGGGGPIYPATQVDIFADSGTGTAGDHDHGATTGNAAPGTDSQGSHDHSGFTDAATAMPPYIVVNRIILAGA